MTNEQQILQNQIEMLKELGVVKVDLAVVKEKVCGNGLEEDVQALQKWQAERPKECPVEARKGKSIVRTGVFIAGFIAALEGIKYLISLI